SPVNYVDQIGLACCPSGKRADCPNGFWIGSAVLVESGFGVGRLEFGGIVFAGAMACPSNPYISVPFVSVCGFGGGPHRPRTGLRAGGGLEFAGAGIGCRGVDCSEDLGGHLEFGGFAQIGPAFGFEEDNPFSRGCFGVGVGAGAGLGGGGLVCRTFI